MSGQAERQRGVSIWAELRAGELLKNAAEAEFVTERVIQDWMANSTLLEEKNGSSKQRTYKLFKETFQLENYLLHQIPNKHRIATTKIRVSCHKLAIEKGTPQTCSPPC